MNYLPPRDCLVLYAVGREPYWVHVRFVDLPLPTWSDVGTGEPIDMESIITWKELPEV
jgi:hypothetical protein